jgi:hypothetical protein
MNLSEGFRRIGIVLGIAGTLGGSAACYIFLNDAFQLRSRYKTFSTLDRTPEVQNTISNSADPWERYDATEFTTEHPSKNGIRRIFYQDSADRRHLEVSRFEMVNGDIVYRAEAPPVYTYVLPLAFPVIGFLIPWGLIKALVWVGSGFTKAHAGYQ